MKNREAGIRLLVEMKALIEAIRANDGSASIIIKTGDVLGALEIFTITNFTDIEQEIIFSCAKAEIERHGGNVEDLLKLLLSKEKKDDK